MRVGYLLCSVGLLLSLFGLGTNGFRYSYLADELNVWEQQLEQSRANDRNADKLAEEYYHQQPNGDRVLDMRKSYKEEIAEQLDAITGSLRIRKKEAFEGTLLNGGLFVVFGVLLVYLRVSKQSAR